MKILNRIFIFFLGIFLFSCGDSKEKEIANIPIEIKIEHFDKIFFETPDTEFSSLKNKFPYLFPENTPDSVWIQKQKDTLQQELFREVSKTFPNFTEEEKQILSAMTSHHVTSIEELVHRTGVSLSHLHPVLLQLELKQLVTHTSQGYVTHT